MSVVCAYRRAYRASLLVVALGALVCVTTLANAQVIPPNAQPGRERERFIEPRQPQARPGGQSLGLPSTTAPAGAKSIKIVVRRIEIVGATVYSQDELKPLYHDLLGRRVSLQAIYDLAQRITTKYGSDGYVLSRAIVPVQQLDPSGASIRIEVVEGYIDRVEWPKQLQRYRDFFSEYARKITADRPINVRTLERYLLLASDLPGLKFSSSLRASKTETGASTLIVEVEEKPVDFNARFDNRGTKSRGPLEFFLSPTFNNLFGQHEALTLAYASVSPTKELQYVSIGYRQVLNSEGLTAFVNGSYSWSFPGTPTLRDLDFNTRATYVEGGVLFPVVRLRERNLNISALAFEGENYSFWNLTPTNPQAVDRLRGIRMRAEGDVADQLGSINQFAATVSHGILGLGSTDNLNQLASRGGGRVDFSKVEASGSRLQPLANRFSAMVSAFGQYAFNPLLVPEQCGYGGRVFGRAFDPSELIADSCWMVSGELRYDLPANLGRQLFPTTTAQLYSFVDKAELYRLSTLPAGTGSAVFRGASAGGGIRMFWNDHLNVDLTAAKAIEGSRNESRFFFVAAVKY